MQGVRERRRCLRRRSSCRDHLSPMRLQADKSSAYSARLPGDPEDYDGEYGDYFRVFVALENETCFELFDDISLEDEPDLLYDKSEAQSLGLKIVEQVMAKDCNGKTVQRVSRRPNGESIVSLTSGQMILVTAEYDTEVCLVDVEEYGRDCPCFFEDMKPVDDS